MGGRRLRRPVPSPEPTRPEISLTQTLDLSLKSEAVASPLMVAVRNGLGGDTEPKVVGRARSLAIAMVALGSDRSHPKRLKSSNC
jgi:hypothetical protein